MEVKYKATVENVSEEELTDKERELLQQLENAVQELHDALFVEEKENESNIS